MTDVTCVLSLLQIYSTYILHWVFGVLADMQSTTRR